MGYRKRELLLSSPELSVAQPTLRLEVEEVKLREVYVRAAPITPRGDTQSYRIKTFAGAQDRYIEDVLRKLPGIEVGTNGQIRYQGKAIDKFYIEGQPDIDDYYSAGVIRRGYRSYTQSLRQLYYRHELNGAARLTYRNPLELFFAYVRLSYRQTAHSYLRDIRLRPEQTLSIPIDTAYRHQSYSVQGVLDKAIPHWALTLRAELGYTHNRHLTALAERIYAVRSDNLLSMLTLRWSRIPALSASYSVGLGSLWYHRSGMESHPSLRLEQELKLVGTLSKLFSLSALLQHTMGEEGVGRGYRHTLFCDVQADWAVSKRVRLAGSLTNLWNERVYSLTSISTTQLEHYTLPLRPRELVLSCTIRL